MVRSNTAIPIRIITQGRILCPKGHNGSLNYYHLAWIEAGEVRFKMDLRASSFMEATFNGPPIFERFVGGDEDGPVLFEEAVVIRHKEVSSQGKKGEVDILISSHGAQLANSFSWKETAVSWLKLAGVGQYVYHLIASWLRMKHQGSWKWR
ncbi:unnamed protein product [Sphenostylis stenocarpa]|uniref:Uncharacterized protein n=1 Tax=Sphenostylis stenocarpa TaxID=92480 RepID=A0AA86SCY3_9FABA|nr:unnamed protein product [Sphenostylis stenocarpa]